jgi:hypothetical protein
MGGEMSERAEATEISVKIDNVVYRGWMTINDRIVTVTPRNDHPDHEAGPFSCNDRGSATPRGNDPAGCKITARLIERLGLDDVAKAGPLIAWW